MVNPNMEKPSQAHDINLIKQFIKESKDERLKAFPNHPEWYNDHVHFTEVARKVLCIDLSNSTMESYKNFFKWCEENGFSCFEDRNGWWINTIEEQSINTKILKTDQEKIAFEGAFTNLLSAEMILSRKELEARVEFQKQHPFDNDVLTPEQILQAENQGLL